MTNKIFKYDFESIIERKSTYASKWTIPDGELPMWVADMDFKTAPEIRDALKKRLDNGIFGYTEVPEEWNNSYISWWKNRHNFDIKSEWLVFSTGVIPTISSAVRKFTTPGEKIVIQTPVYNIFFNSILNNGRNVLESPLIYNNGEYTIDFKDLEEKLSDPQVSMMILCNPHNPVGKIWDKDTLQKIGELCKKYNVIVISDEVHCDLTDPGKEYIPFASVSDTCRDISITCIAPTKCFNIAGLQTSAVMVPNPLLRHRIWRSVNTDEVGEPNAFAIDATIAAFNNGGNWLTELMEYVYINKTLVRDYVNENIKDLSIVKSEATYLLWIDCSKLTSDSKEFANFIRKETGLYLSNGVQNIFYE